MDYQYHFNGVNRDPLIFDLNNALAAFLFLALTGAQGVVISVPQSDFPSKTKCFSFVYLPTFSFTGADLPKEQNGGRKATGLPPTNTHITL